MIRKYNPRRIALLEFQDMLWKSGTPGSFQAHTASSVLSSEASHSNRTKSEVPGSIPIRVVLPEPLLPVSAWAAYTCAKACLAPESLLKTCAPVIELGGSRSSFFEQEISVPAASIVAIAIVKML